MHSKYKSGRSRRSAILWRYSHDGKTFQRLFETGIGRNSKGSLIWTLYYTVETIAVLQLRRYYAIIMFFGITAAANVGNCVRGIKHWNKLDISSNSSLQNSADVDWSQAQSD